MCPPKSIEGYGDDEDKDADGKARCVSQRYAWGMPPERLFRDDAGAALERVARIEEENGGLRAEVERLRHGKTTSTVRLGGRSPSPWVVLGIAAAPAFLGIVLIAASLSSPAPPPPAVRVEVPPPRAPRVAKVSSVTKPECSPPFYYDEGGHKHYKAACLR